MTGPCKQIGVIRAAVLLGEDVIDVKGQKRKVAFVQTAVLAPLFGSLSNKTSKRPLHSNCPRD